MAELTKDRSAEFSALSKQQFAALEKATFLGMTIEETVERSLPTSGFSPLVSLFSQVVSHRGNGKDEQLGTNYWHFLAREPLTRKLVAGLYRRRQQPYVVPRFDPVLAQASNPNSSHVSYLAQTRKSAPVII